MNLDIGILYERYEKESAVGAAIRKKWSSSLKLLRL